MTIMMKDSGFVSLKMACMCVFDVWTPWNGQAHFLYAARVCEAA